MKFISLLINSCLLVLAFTLNANAQCNNPINFYLESTMPSASPLFDHYMSAKRDTSESKPYLYVAAKEDGLKIINVSSISSPTPVTTISVNQLNGLDVNSVTQSGNYLYLALGDIFSNTAQYSGMAIVDIANPQAPVVKDVYSHTTKGGAGFVAVEGNYAYVAAMQNGILVLDVSDKANIQFVSQFIPDVNYPVNNPDLTKINARSMVVKNDVIYLCYDAGGVRIINASNKNSLKDGAGKYANPALINRPRAYNNLILNDTLIYVAADYCGMEILNVKDTSNIVPVGWWNPWHCENPSNTWFNSPGHTNEIEFDPTCKTVFMSAGRTDLIAVNVSNPSAPDSCSQFGLKTDSVGTWGLGHYKDQIYLCYISTWPLFIPFRSETSGVKIITYNNSCALGLKESSNQNESIEIYPNPSDGNFSIKKMNDPIEKLWITTLSGQVVFECKAKESDFNPHLLSGIYLVNIQSSKTRKVQKLIILSH